MTAKDHIINFGRWYGKRITEVSRDYLAWMTTQEGPGPISRGGWNIIAKEEMVRREADDAKAGPKEVVPVAQQAVDDASVWLLREFVIRRDRQQPISKWVEELAGEARKYGIVRDKSEDVGLQKLMATVGCTRIAYLGRMFVYLDGVLEAIKPDDEPLAV